MRVEVREIRVFRGVLDEPPIEQRPEDQDRRRMKNTAQSASTALPSSAKVFWMSRLQPAQLAFRVGFGHIHNALPIEGEIDAEGDQRAEDGAKHPTLAHVEPISLTLMIETAP